MKVLSKIAAAMRAPERRTPPAAETNLRVRREEASRRAR